MAGAYAAGAFMPIIPVAFGFLSRGAALGIAVVLALLTLFFLGYGKAVVSHSVGSDPESRCWYWHRRRASLDSCSAPSPGASSVSMCSQTA